MTGQPAALADAEAHQESPRSVVRQNQMRWPVAGGGGLALSARGALQLPASSNLGLSLSGGGRAAGRALASQPGSRAQPSVGWAASTRDRSTAVGTVGSWLDLSSPVWSAVPDVPWSSLLEPQALVRQLSPPSHGGGGVRTPATRTRGGSPRFPPPTPEEHPAQLTGSSFRLIPSQRSRIAVAGVLGGLWMPHGSHPSRARTGSSPGKQAGRGRREAGTAGSDCARGPLRRRWIRFSS